MKTGDEVETIAGVYLGYEDNTELRKRMNVPDNIILRTPGGEVRVGVWGPRKGEAPVKPILLMGCADGSVKISVPIKRNDYKGKEYLNFVLERASDLKVIEKLAKPEPRFTNDDYWRKKFDFDMQTHRGGIRRSCMHAAVELHCAIMARLPGTHPPSMDKGTTIADVTRSVKDVALELEKFVLDAETSKA